ncbi:MAG: hypothetical protein NW224_04790 [Leptolyngbyaceae cyanobacterium bins.302]|nr:hypothetical protein [Leptolyngbyaceae cyanobacterium bins.302]
MTTKERLMQELESAPEEFLEEVLSFVLATKERETQLSNGVASTPENNPPSDEEPTGIAALVALAERFAAEMTPEEIAQLPADGALEHDHYIYGTPKRYS